MSNYTKATDFAEKDGLPTNDPNKVIKGAEFEDEFDLIATAVNSKSDTASPTFTGTATLPTAVVTTLSLGGTTITSTGTELNILDGVTATTAELNYVDGVTSNIQTQLDAKGTVSSLSDLSVTATAAELNKLDGVTATTAELNYIDGVTSNIQTQLDAKGTVSSLSDLSVTATAAELNFVDGVTSNIQTQLDAKGTVSSLSDLSVTATADELNKLDGVTATTAELNLVDGLTAIPDYVTGIFTPVVADNFSGGNTASVGTANGRYTKVGRMVHVTIQLVDITTTGMSGNIYVRDLPFTAYDSGSPNMLWMGTLYASQVATGTDGPFVPQIIDNTDYIQFIRSITSSSQFTRLVVSDLTSGASDMYISISYEAA